MKLDSFDLQEIRRTRKLFDEVKKKEQEEPGLWPVYDSGLTVLDQDFRPVLNANSFVHALQKWQNISGDTIRMVDLGGTGRKMARELKNTPLRIERTLSVSMWDPRGTKEKLEDSLRKHTVIEGNVWSASLPRRIVETMGARPNVIISHMTGGLMTAPNDWDYIIKVMERYFRILDRKGLFIGQVGSANLKATLLGLERRLQEFQTARKSELTLRTSTTRQRGSGGQYLLLHMQKLN